MQTKLIELRDRGTFIACLAVSIDGNDGYLARRAGYGDRCILFMRADGRSTMTRCEVTYDPYDWRDRTFTTAHLWLTEHWDEVRDHDVVDVEYILGETDAPKRSEREDSVTIAFDETMR